MNAKAWTAALEAAARAIDMAGGAVDLLDVGGGFPAPYRGDEPSFRQISAEIRKALEELSFPEALKVLCEPGRALVAGGMSAVVRVELRRGDSLYLNDGVYGGPVGVEASGPCFPFACNTAGRSGASGRRCYVPVSWSYLR